MARKRNADGYVLKSEVKSVVQNYIRIIQMNDYSNDEGVPQLYWVEGLIDRIPTADVVEVKHGEWKSFEIPHMMRCSECGVSDLDILRTTFAFCPHCGAKMDGERGDT